MTTYKAPKEVVPVDPRPNKAVVAGVGTIVSVGLSWLVSGKFTLDNEGIVALGGAVTTVLVYAVSNYKKLLGK